MIFVDTSALVALLDQGEERHRMTAVAFERLLGAATPLLTTNYVMIETTAVLQRRLGMTAVRAFEEDLRPLLQVEWIDEALHRTGVAAHLAANRRGLSLVDCTSFEVMRRAGLRRAFALDDDFVRQGFEVIPSVGDVSG